MAAITTTFSNEILQLIFNATGIPNIADNTATSPLTSIYVSLHTANPGASGAQNTSEAAYGGYARVAVVRTNSGWTIASENCNPVAVITFPTCTSGSETETYFGIGSASSGAGALYFFGPISPSIPISTGIVPQLTTSTVINIS